MKKGEQIEAMQICQTCQLKLSKLWQEAVPVVLLLMVPEQEQLVLQMTHKADESILVPCDDYLSNEVEVVGCKQNYKSSRVFYCTNLLQQY